MVTPNIRDLEDAFYGGGVDSEYQFLLDARAAGVTAQDLTALASGGSPTGAYVPVAGSYATATTKAVGSKVTGDSNDRFTRDASGKMSWGGGSAAPGLTLSRLNDFYAQLEGGLLASGLSGANYGGTFANLTYLGATAGPVSAAAISFGASLDSNIRRIAAASLRTNSALTVDGLLTTSAGLSIAGGQNIALSATTGTKIGTATTQKLSFYNATPVVQGAAVADAAGGSTIDIQARAQLNALLARIRGSGLIAT